MKILDIDDNLIEKYSNTDVYRILSTKCNNSSQRYYLAKRTIDSGIIHNKEIAFYNQIYHMLKSIRSSIWEQTHAVQDRAD